MTVTRTERGWAGHFCGASECHYHRNTLLELGNQRIVVSTVGNYIPASRGRIDAIGHRRHYETMAFMAAEQCGYWEADVERQVVVCSPWSIWDLTPTVDAQADAMHEAVVAELSAKMIAGTIEVTS